MPIPVTTWDEIDQADFDAVRSLQTEIIAERHPEISTRSGAISDLVLTLHGVLGAAGMIERTRLLESNSLLLAIQNPAAIDSGTLDALFSNYFVTRQSGGFGVGQVTLVLSQASPLVIPSGFVFTAGTRDFTAVASFAARTSAAAVLSSTDRVLTLQSDGTFTLVIDVQAAMIGAAGGLRQGATLTLSKSLPFVTQAYATNDFTGAADPESNTDLVNRLELGLAAKTWSNATNTAATIRQQPGFSAASVSVIGAGDPEMIRDKHSLFPLAYGNRVDAYVKTAGLPSVATVPLAAVYIGPGVSGPIWQISMGRTDIVGFYAISQLLRVGRIASAVVAPLTVSRTYTAAAGDPDIAVAVEAAFSSFQSAVVTFIDAAEPGDVLVPNVTSVAYQVTGIFIGGLDTLQASLTAPAVKPLAGDMVVRAAVPCLVSVNIDFDVITADLPKTAIAAAVAGYVNKLGYGVGIYNSHIVGIVAGFLPSSINLQRVQLSGIILGPDGSRKLYRSLEFLGSPNDPANMITPNTVGFFLDPADIAFNTITK
jgi:hypothetical protein